MQIRFTIKGLEEVQAWLKDLPFLVRQKAAGWVAEYMIGDDSHGLKHEPAYRPVSRVAAYGVSFFTEKQRRWFFAALHDGRINPWQNNRTHKFADSWAAKPTGAGGFQLTNTAPYAQHLAGTIGNDNRARQPAMVGWRWVKDTISSNFAGAIRHAQAKVREWAKAQKVNR
jgi:hypothetical protein